MSEIPAQLPVPNTATTNNSATTVPWYCAMFGPVGYYVCHKFSSDNWFNELLEFLGTWVDYIKDCFHSVFAWFTSGRELKKPETACFATVVGVTGLSIIIVFGAGYFISGDISVFADFFEWIFSFLTQFGSYLVTFAKYSFDVLSWPFGWAFDLLEDVAEFTNSNPAFWRIMGILGLADAATTLLLRSEPSLVDWENSWFYKFFYVLDYPFSWLREQVEGVLGKVGGFLAGLLTFPFDAGMLVVSFLVGGIAYPFKLLWDKLTKGVNQNKTATQDKVNKKQD